MRTKAWGQGVSNPMHETELFYFRTMFKGCITHQPFWSDCVICKNVEHCCLVAPRREEPDADRQGACNSHRKYKTDTQVSCAQVLEATTVMTRARGPKAPSIKVAECLVADSTGVVVFVARNEQGKSNVKLGVGFGTRSEPYARCFEHFTCVQPMSRLRALRSRLKAQRWRCFAGRCGSQSTRQERSRPVAICPNL